MAYRSLKACIDDLAATNQLVRIEEEVDPHLEMAEIHRRVYRAGGPAVLYANVKGCRFPAVSNLFGTLERARFLFRDTIERVEQLVRLKADPGELGRHPLRSVAASRSLWHMRPKFVRRGPILQATCRVSDLPQIKSWPDDGGPFVLLPAVYSEDAQRPGVAKSNLGMYRIQLAGNDYRPDEEIGLHYQLHRGIGVHHTAALQAGVPFRVNIFVGGPPALTVAAVMPLPEGLPELYFAGALGGRRVPLIRRHDALPLISNADFCISGTVDPNRLLPEGPFGDHLGYYSLKHDFPVLKVDRVYHRRNAIWPFTIVGRPPQEDTSFGQLIHELTGPAIPAVVPGVQEVHAVDAAGVHPLLLALGSERYWPHQERRRPQELLTQASAILGQGQMSLAKYLFIAATQDDPDLDLHDIGEFFQHVLRRVNWRRDLHFHTNTTIDTLDYSGSGLNEGSKLVVAAVGVPLRELPTEVPADLRLPEGFDDPRLCLPGVLAVRGPQCRDEDDETVRTRFCERLTADDTINHFPLVVIVDDSEFTSKTLNNFLWITFTRSNPAPDVHGIEAFTQQKHWGCRGSLVIDARTKPHHAPPLVEDPQVTQHVDRLFASGGPLSGIE